MFMDIFTLYLKSHYFSFGCDHLKARAVFLFFFCQLYPVDIAMPMALQTSSVFCCVYFFYSKYFHAFSLLFIECQTHYPRSKVN